MRIALWMFPIFLAFGAATAPRALADPLAKPASSNARSHLALGNKLYGVRSFDEAAAEYKAGALIEPAPVFDYNLGQCFRQLGKYQEAIWHYERFVKRGDPQGQLLDAVTGFITQMRSELDRKATAMKPIEPEPTSRSTAPAPIVRPAAFADPPPVESWYRDGLGWGLSTSGVLGLAAGSWFLFDARHRDSEANTEPDQRASRQQHDTAATRYVLGIGIGVGGAGLLAAGILKLAICAERPSRAVAWHISVSTRGPMVFGSF